MTSQRALRIAVADDDPLLRDFFQQALSVLGYEVVALASDGDELVEQCQETRPDLVITDMDMPRLNGVEALERIWQAAAEITAVLISAIPGAGLLAEQTCRHPMVCVTKPFSLDELDRAICQAVATCANPGAATPMGGANTLQVGAPAKVIEGPRSTRAARSGFAGTPRAGESARPRVPKSRA